MKREKEEKESQYLKGPFIENNNISFVKKEKDGLIIKMVGEDKHINGYGIFHGGVFFMLADTAAGLLLASDGKESVTLQGSMNFVNNVKGGTVYAHSKYVSSGMKNNIIEVEILDENKKLLALGTFNFYRVNIEAIKRKFDVKEKECQ